MNYNRKIMRLELSAEKALNGGYYYAELLLPAADYEIKDAMQRTRAVGRESTVEVSSLECDILPELQDIRLDTFSLDELNFFAKRLASLPNEELPVFYAVTEQIFDDAEESETVDDEAVETETDEVDGSADVEEDEAAASYEDEDFSEFAEFGSTDEYEQLAEEDTNEDA